MRRLMPNELWQVAQLAARLDGALVQFEVAARRREAARWRDLCDRNAGWRDEVVGRLIRPQVRCASSSSLRRRAAAPPNSRSVGQARTAAHGLSAMCLSCSQLDDMLRQLQQLQQRHQGSASLPDVDAQGEGAGRTQPSQPSSACSASASTRPTSGEAAVDKAGMASVAALQAALQERMACRTRLLRVKAGLTTQPPLTRPETPETTRQRV